MKNNNNWFYILVAVLFGSMLYISARYFKGSGNSSVGLAKAKEYKINSEKSAVVSTIYVVPGQQVKANDLLIELISTGLEMDIEKLTSKISVLKSEQGEKAKLAQSEVDYVKAETEITLEEINTDIDQIKSEMALNQRLSKEFSAKPDSSINLGIYPLQTKLNSLSLQKDRHKQAIAIKIRDIEQENRTEQNQLVNQIRLLEQELQLMKGEKEKLKKFATTDGLVDNVYVKEGEQVNAFTQLLSVVPIRPTTIVGYLLGKKFNIPKIGEAVIVNSYEQKTIPVQGKVIGYGSVIELPKILQKSTAVTAFGREIFIEIPADNNFANGEKVLIR